MRTGRFAVLLVVLALLGGCQKDNGAVGISYPGSVECLGEAANPVQGDTVYVSPEGDDDNSGISPDAPKATLSTALCNLRPGQTLHILPGNYHESVIMGAFGDHDQAIVIEGVAAGDQVPLLDGQNELVVGLALVECSNIVVKNLEFRNYTDQGLWVVEGSDFIIEGNRFISNGQSSSDSDLEGEGYGVNVDGAQRVVIVGNEAAENGPSPERVQQAILGTGINTYGNQDVVIRNNHSHHNAGGGILVEDSINVLVEENRIDHNELDAAGDWWDGGIWIDGGREITLRNNIITDNHGPGIEISDEDVQYPEASRNYLVENNTITGNIMGIYVWNYGLCPVTNPDILQLRGNIIEDNLETDIECLDWACGKGRACD